MNRPPAIDMPFDHLPFDPEDRHELMVDLFGVHFIWAIQEGMRKSVDFVESIDNRQRLGRIPAEPYEQLAEAFNTEQRKLIFSFAEKAIENAADEVLGLLTHQGIALPLGTEHAITFRLIMEIREKEDMNVVREEVINRDGKKA